MLLVDYCDLFRASQVSSGTSWLKVSYGNVASYERGGVETAINEVLENVAPSLRRVDHRNSRLKKTTTEVTPGSGHSAPFSDSSQRSESNGAVAKSSMSSGVTEVELRPKSEWTTERALSWIFRRFQVCNATLTMFFLLHSLFGCLLF